MIRACDSDEAFRAVLADSARVPVYLMKHSTRCGISARAHVAFEQFAREIGDRAECWQVLVIEDRPLSQAIAAETGVTHQSPQMLLFKDGRVVWNTSHGMITRDALERALPA
jgi:bacillithiol system protein YtxJ